MFPEEIYFQLISVEMRFLIFFSSSFLIRGEIRFSEWLTFMLNRGYQVRNVRSNFMKIHEISKFKLMGTKLAREN